MILTMIYQSWSWKLKLKNVSYPWESKCLFVSKKKIHCVCFRSNFHLSVNGSTVLSEEKKLSESDLHVGDVVYLINETTSSLSMDQPLTLDEVRDIHTYPVVMHRLVECSHPENDFDYIVLALHALMLESGFQMVRKDLICSLEYVLFVVGYR